MKYLSIDIEATGLNPVSDRIVELAMAVYDRFPQEGDQPVDSFDLFFNPGFAMSAEVIAVHGITDERVKDCPPFAEHAHAIRAEIGSNETVLIGFNLWRFDLPILWEEFYRAGINWSWKHHPIIDVGNLFKLREQRTLEAAVKFYCGREHPEAHSAWGDAVATANVLAAQITRYADLQTMTPAGVMAASKMGDNVDLAVKIVLNPAGEPVYAFGKSKDVRVVDDLGFAHWMLDRDFPTETKITLTTIIDQWKRSKSTKGSPASTRPE